MLTKQRKTALSMQSTLFQVRKCRSLFSGIVCAKRSQSAPNVNKTTRAKSKDLTRRELEMVESGNIPAQGLFASFEPLKFWTENAENN